MRQLLRETSLTGARVCAREGEERERDLTCKLLGEKEMKCFFSPQALELRNDFNDF